MHPNVHSRTWSQPAATSATVAIMSADDPAADRETWMRVLSPADQAACARDLAAATDPTAFDKELIAWRESAIAAGLNQTANLEWLDGDDVVERP